MSSWRRFPPSWEKLHWRGPMTINDDSQDQENKFRQIKLKAMKKRFRRSKSVKLMLKNNKNVCLSNLDRSSLRWHGLLPQIITSYYYYIVTWHNSTHMIQIIEAFSGGHVALEEDLAWNDWATMYQQQVWSIGKQTSKPFWFLCWQNTDSVRIQAGWWRRRRRRKTRGKLVFLQI